VDITYLSNIDLIFGDLDMRNCTPSVDYILS